MATQLVQEAASPSSEAVVAYRGRHRWIQTFEAAPTASKPGVPKLLKEGGVYLITGGAGGIGLTLASYLARETRACLALIGRSKFPERETWQDWIDAHDEKDEISASLHAIQTMETDGGEVLYLSANVTDREQMRNAIEQVKQRFGAINGVIHSAGSPAGGLIQLKTKEMSEPILAAKTTGTLVLDELLDYTQLDFFMLCSSIASISGSEGQVDYTAANAFLDAFAQAKASSGDCPVVSVNWDAWNEVGMAVKAKELWPMLPDGTVDFGKLHNIGKPSLCDHPLLTRAVIEDTEAIFFGEFSVERDWVVREHLVMGRATLVGTAYLELARAAFERYSGESSATKTFNCFGRRSILPSGWHPNGNEIAHYSIAPIPRTIKSNPQFSAPLRPHRLFSNHYLAD